MSATVIEYEPDHKRWEHAGLPCIVDRAPQSLNLSGWVGVPRDHPWHAMSRRVARGVECHRGVDGTDTNAPGSDTADGAFWWFYFHCAHHGDYVPNGSTGQCGSGDWDDYRNFAYVTRETERLAEQLAEARSAEDIV